MLRATAVVRKPAVKEDRAADTAWLDHAARGSRHAAVTSHGGLEFMLDLGTGAVLNDGDAVRLEDGRLVQVKAAPERLLEIRAENPLRLLRLAWQLGQRHALVELKADAIYVAEDPTLAEMARGQGCGVSPVTRPFHPERQDEHACAHHDHGHGGPAHVHGHDPDHHHARDHKAEHEHGAACGCGHERARTHEH
jgi:urease accessory protein